MNQRGRLIRRIFALVVSVISMALLAVGCAISCRPSDYRPVTLDYTRLESDKRALSDILERIGVELNHGRPVEFEIEEEQLNRWIAARRELPIDPAAFEVQGLQKPAVRLMDGKIRLYGLAERSGWQTVISLDVSVTPSSDMIRVAPVRAAFGAAPLPGMAMDTVRDTLKDLLTPEGAKMTADGVELPNRAVWENGERPFRFESIEIKSGKAKIKLAPLR